MGRTEQTTVRPDISDDKEEASDRQPDSRREQDRENPPHHKGSGSVSSLAGCLYLFSVIRIDFDSPYMLPYPTHLSGIALCSLKLKSNPHSAVRLYEKLPYFTMRKPSHAPVVVTQSQA